MTETEQLLERVAAAARNPEQGDGSSLPARADRTAVARAETALGFALPPLLAGLYTRIADGGFGPEYGLLPVHSAVERHLADRASGRTDPDWPVRLPRQCT